jgi:hypothetical protein
MRCPKCGYISFDLVDECLKCKKNIQSASEVLQGSVLKFSPPSFLKFRRDTNESREVETGFSNEISPMETDFADEDSDFLSDDIDFSDDETGEIEIASGSFESNDFEQDAPTVSLDEDGPEGEIEVDLSQFEEVSDPEAAFLSEEEEVSLADDEDVHEISVPEELVDMSDLDPPAFVAEEVESDDFELDLDSGPVDLDLDDLNFDLVLDDVDDKDDFASEPVQETVLALDDIDFSDALSEESGADETAPASMDMDADLDFDLDLGGLSIHKDI